MDRVAGGEDAPSTEPNARQKGTPQQQKGSQLPDGVVTQPTFRSSLTRHGRREQPGCSLLPRAPVGAVWALLLRLLLD